MIPDSTHYTFKDSSLISVVNKETKILRPLYRVRRASTEIWGWDDNPTNQSTNCIMGTLRLLLPINAHSDWQDESEYKIKVNWDYEKQEDYYAVWNEHATMKIVVKMQNRDGKLLETEEHVLTRDEIFTKEKVLKLSRPCVKYSIEIVVDPKTSPFGGQGLGNENGFSIFTHRDREELQQFIANHPGEAVSVALESDLSLDETDGLGSVEAPFKGVFNGKGHTLTIHNAAPFQYAENATISQLHVSGEINNGNDQAGMVKQGLWATISNCRVDVDFTVSGIMAAFCHTVTYVNIRNSAIWDE